MPSGQPSIHPSAISFRTLTEQELDAVHGGVQSKGEEMCEFTEECERSQSRTAS
jgi:hypothetical protein